MHRPTRIARRLMIPVLALFAAAVLAGCGSLSSIQAPADAAAQAALATVDDAFTAEAAADGSDLSPANLTVAAPGVSQQDVTPTYVIRRTGMRRQRTLTSLTYDGLASPPTAHADVAVTVTGTAEIWSVYPDASIPRTLAGSKPIDLSGTVGFDLEKDPDGWRVVAVRASALTQGAYAATVADVSTQPDPLIVGGSDNVAMVTLQQPDAADSMLVVARGRRLVSHGVLHDDGVTPDATADDDVFGGAVSVAANARPGTHLAFVTALDYSRTIDLSQSGGAYLEPYTSTVQPVLVMLAANP